MTGKDGSGAAIAERIRVISARRSLSISEVGRRADISRSTMQRILNGQSPTVEQLEAIGAALEVPPSELLGSDTATVRPNPALDPAMAKLVDAVERQDARLIRHALTELLPGEVYDKVVGGVVLPAEERKRLADALVLVGRHLVREGEAVAGAPPDDE